MIDALSQGFAETTGYQPNQSFEQFNPRVAAAQTVDMFHQTPVRD